MKVSLALFSLIFATNVLAQGASVPHQFSNGNAVVASEFNANFQNLANRNDGTQAQVTQNAADIASVQSTLSNVEGTVTQIQADISSLQSALGGNSSSLLQFVGNSSGTIDGAQGLRAMTELCQADYPASRMCTSEEYAKTTIFPPPISGASYAWIAATNVSLGSNGGYRDQFGPPVSNSQENQFSCQGWSNVDISSKALSVSGIGYFKLSDCINPLPVSCCK